MKLSESERQRLLSHAAVLARTVRRRLSSGSLLVQIAGHLAGGARAADFAHAIREVQAMSEKMEQPDRALLTIDIGKCLASNGDVPSAEKIFAEVTATAGGMHDLVQSHGLLFRLAEAYCDLQWHGRALSLADRLTEDVHKNGVLAAISRKCIEAGNLILAFEAIQRMSNPSAKASQIVNIILSSLQRQNISEADYQMLQQIILSHTRGTETSE